MGARETSGAAVAGELVQDDEKITELDMSALTQITRGEVDSQIATAHAYPRDIKQFLVELETLATINTDVAESCFYTLKRKEADGSMKKIEGPSVRFAELVAACYGNLRINARTVREDDRYVYASGVAWDIQKNVAIGFETRRRITGRNGNRYGDDMIAVTANAASSIALRNAVFRVVPKAFWQAIYDKTRAVAVGDAKTLSERRDRAIAFFVQNLAVDRERVFAYLGIENLEQFTLEHLEELQGLKTGLKEGDIKMDEAFPPVKADEKPGTPGDSKLDALTKNLAGDKPANPQPAVVQEQTPTTKSAEELSAEENAKLDREIAEKEAQSDAPAGDLLGAPTTSKPKK